MKNRKNLILLQILSKSSLIDYNKKPEGVLRVLVDFTSFSLTEHGNSWSNSNSIPICMFLTKSFMFP